MIDARVLAAYVDRGLVPDGPLTVHVDIIHDCNLRCPACWIHSPLVEQSRTEQSPAPESRLSLPAFTRILDELAEAKVKRIILSGGGEPFLHPDIYEMIAKSGESGMRVTVLSNGTLIDGERLADSPPSRIIINYAAMRQTEDPDGYIRRLVRFGSLIPLNLVIVVETSTLPGIAELVENSARIPGAQITFKPASLSEATSQLSLSVADREELLNRILPRSRRFLEQAKIRHNLDMFEAQLELSGKDGAAAGFSDGRKTGCYAGIFYSRIYTNGDVFFCCAHIKAGNMNAAGFSDIWKGEQYEAIRRRLRRGAYFPCCAQCGKYNLNYEARQALEVMGKWKPAAE